MTTYPDDDIRSVMVPQNDRPLVPTSPDRINRLRSRLQGILTFMRQRENGEEVHQPPPEGFHGKVASTACALCQGWCCHGGGDDGFLEEAALARHVNHMPADAVVRMYVECVPDVSYEKSCIFHGAGGCTLDRSLRSDICIEYHCDGLRSFFRSPEPPGPTVVISGKLAKRRLSPVLTP